MFKNVLVPIDLSEQSKWALATALELARQSGARVTLLHVIQRLAGGQPAEFAEFYRRLLKISERRLTGAARAFTRSGIAVRTEAAIGEPVAEIVRAATKNRVDLMVMGSHRVDPTGPTRGWGTISYRVGLLCECPVLLVKRDAARPRRRVRARRGRQARARSPGRRRRRDATR